MCVDATLFHTRKLFLERILGQIFMVIKLFIMYVENIHIDTFNCRSETGHWQCTMTGASMLSNKQCLDI